jgi:hypothetical protein
VTKHEASTLHKVITGESFIEKFALLLLTGLLSGLLLPYVIARYNNGVSTRQKESDFARSKDEAILQAQSKLVEEFATVVLTYETLVLDVSWYKTGAGKDELLYEKAYAKYSDRIVDLLSSWRSLSARSQTLTSPEIAREMNDFQILVFKEQDTPTIALSRSGATEHQWEEQHEKNEEMLGAANALIAKIMRDVALSKSDLNRPNAHV